MTTSRTFSHLAILLSLLGFAVALSACGDDDAGATPDASTADASTDAARDANVPVDAGMPDLTNCPDEDGDGRRAASCGGDDCDDADATRYPTAAEECDGDDEDCNDTTFGTDADSDGFESDLCCNGAGNCGLDCNDGAVDVNPDATESCNAGVDDDCDGLADSADGACIPCPGGYSGIDSSCVDIDECLEGTAACTQIPVATCENTVGAFRCNCPAGYMGDGRGGGGCTNIDECVTRVDDCDGDPDACNDAIGSYTCMCPSGFTGLGRGAAGCAWATPSLLSLVVGAGATLSPAFSPTQTSYTLSLAPGATSTTLTPTLAYPSHGTITVGGTALASGASRTLTVSGFAVQTVQVVVTSTDTSASITYTLVVGRGSTYMKASNSGLNDQFGYAVALSADGTTLAVSAFGEASNATGIGGDQTNNSAAQAGAVYVLRRTGTTWAQEAYIKASNTAAGDWFGRGIALSSDGSTLAVGAPQEDSNATGIGGSQSNNSAGDSGAAYVFRRTGTTWAQEAYVKASNTGGLGARFGHALALSSDGTTLAVGAPGEQSDSNGIDGVQADVSASQAGAVYLFRRTGAVWAQTNYVKASNSGAGDQFGWSVALSATGSVLAVGARYESSNATGIGGNASDDSALGAGAAYVYRRTGAAWAQEAYVKASNTDAQDDFGFALALSGDGNTLVVGAPGEASSASGIGGDQSDDSLMRPGAAYVFRAIGSVWAQEAYVKASNTRTFTQVGSSAAASADGSIVAVGAVGDSSAAVGIGGDQADASAFSGAGAVYLLRRSAGAWAQEAYVKASNSGTSDFFGSSIALSSDGAQLASSATGEQSNATGIGGDQTNDSVMWSGAVYFY